MEVKLLRGQANLLTNFKDTVLAAVAGTGGGKAIDIDTPIPTPNGWQKMRDLQVGDSVFDLKGESTCITFVSPIMDGHQCYRVTFDDKSSLVVDAGHLWRVQRFNDRKHIFRQRNIRKKFLY